MLALLAMLASVGCGKRPESGTESQDWYAARSVVGREEGGRWWVHLGLTHNPQAGLPLKSALRWVSALPEHGVILYDIENDRIINRISAEAIPGWLASH